MKTGLLLEGGGMRGLYTAGVLDVLMENSIKIDTIIGVSAGALFGMNYKSKQKGRVLRYNKKYLDGGIADSIPIDKIMNMNFDRVIVVLTRPINYRKKKTNKIFPKIYYRKYPKFVETINNRYIRYNEQLNKILDLEKNKKIFVIRPSKLIKIGRVEKDCNKIQKMYDLGNEDSTNLLEQLKEYLK